MIDRHILRKHVSEEDAALRCLMDANSSLEGALLLEAYLASAEETAPSEELERTCQRTIRRHFRCKRLQRKLQQHAQHAACFLLATATVGLLTLCISPEARAVVSQWLSGWEGGLYVYAPTDTDETTPDYSYHVSAVPEGYHFTSEFIIPTGGLVRYQDEEEAHSLYLTYCRQDEGAELGLIITEESHKAVTVNGIHADLYYYPDLHDDSSLVWVDSETNYLLHISGYFPEAELIAIAQSVVHTVREEDAAR